MNLFKKMSYSDASKVFFNRGQMIDAIHEENMEKMKIEGRKAEMNADLKHKELNNKLEIDRKEAERKYQDMKDKNMIRQIEVEGENRIKEAKLKGEIDEKLQKVKIESNI